MYIKIQHVVAVNVGLILLLTAPFSAFADSVEIVNSVSATANSGGNSAFGGEVIEGNAFVDFFVETIVNGETLTHIDEHIESEVGEPVEVSIEDTVVSGGGSTTVHTDVEVNGSSIDIERVEDHEHSEVVEMVEGEIGEELEGFSFKNFFTQIFSYVFKLF